MEQKASRRAQQQAEKNAPDSSLYHEKMVAEKTVKYYKTPPSGVHHRHPCYISDFFGCHFPQLNCIHLIAIIVGKINTSLELFIVSQFYLYKWPCDIAVTSVYVDNGFHRCANGLIPWIKTSPKPCHKPTPSRTWNTTIFLDTKLHFLLF